MIEEHNNFEINFHQRKDFNFKGVELTTCLIIDEALKRGIKAEFVLGKYLELTFKGEKKLFYLADNSSLSYLAQKITASKTETKVFLKRVGLSVPEGKRFQREDLEGIISYAGTLEDGAVVIKPDSGSEGKGVYCGVAKADIENVVKEIAKKGFSYLIVEELVKGNEYRVIATAKGYLAVMLRRPANVLGDGRHSIKELIEEKNIGRVFKATKPLSCPFIKIEVDDVVRKYMAKKGITLEDVPQESERVYLRENSNISTGGDSIELTDKVHLSVKEIALRALGAVPGMSYTGLDLVTEDITKDIKKGYALIEMNNLPGIWPLHYPYIGKPQNIAGALMDLVFPDSQTR